MKKLFLFTMFFGFATMFTSAQSGNTKVITATTSKTANFVPKPFRYEGKNSLVTIIDNTANVYGANLDWARSFNLQIPTGQWSNVYQQYVDGQWIDVGNAGMWYSVGIYECKFTDYDETIGSSSFIFTQTLFNNDEKYEYIVPVFDPNAEIVISEYDNNGDGIMENRTIQRGAITGMNVMNEDGTVIATLDSYSSTSLSIEICKFESKFYLLKGSSGSDGLYYYYFYAIDKDASNVQFVKKIQATSDRIFTLDGREHNEFQHGLNIINGRKVIVK